jgi:ribosomal protein S18 acetylase RimI-like enzyme
MYNNAMFGQKPVRMPQHMEITLEKATKEDMIFVVGLYMHKGENFASIPGETFVAKNRKGLAVGAVTIEEIKPTKPEGIKLPLANIRTFEVDIEHLRMHIGDQMIKGILEELKKRGFHTVTIELGHDKDIYIEFLLKQDFREYNKEIMIRNL